MLLEMKGKERRGGEWMSEIEEKKGKGVVGMP